MAVGFAALPFVASMKQSAAPFLILFGVLFTCYILALRFVLRPQPISSPAALRAVLVLSLVFRAGLLFAPPMLSDDLHRYLWDGRVLLSGDNPYRHPPESEALRDLRGDLYDRLDHREVRTVYPPAAQLIFAAGSLFGAGAAGLKALLILADILGIVLLRRVLVGCGLPPLRILIYAWNPLAVIEIAWSGHLEPVGTLCVIVAAVAIIQKRDFRATVALTLGALVKLLPLALFVPLLRSLRARCLLLVPLLAGAAYWPFRGAGADLFGGAREYARRWVANESLFALVHAAVSALDPTPALKRLIAMLRSVLPGSGPLETLYSYVYPDDLARAICVLAVAGLGLALYRRRVEPLRGMFLMTAAILLLSPTLHPWYLLWILPWLCLFPSRAWLLLSGLVSLAYLNAGVPREAEPYPWIRWIEYLPFYGVLAWEILAAARRRRAGGALVPRRHG
jgi:hypothetical protein